MAVDEEQYHQKVIWCSLYGNGDSNVCTGMVTGGSSMNNTIQISKRLFLTFSVSSRV